MDGSLATPIVSIVFSSLFKWYSLGVQVRRQDTEEAYQSAGLLFVFPKSFVFPRSSSVERLTKELKWTQPCLRRDSQLVPSALSADVLILLIKQHIFV